MTNIIIESYLLGKIFNSILINKTPEFEFHLVLGLHKCPDNDEQLLTFQTNYMNIHYTSYTINPKLLTFFNIFDFEIIYFNYEQCIKIIKLSNMYPKLNINISKIDDNVNLTIADGSFSLCFKLDNKISEEYIYPPEHNLNIPFIDINRILFLNMLKLCQEDKFLMPMEINSHKKYLILGDDTQIVSKIMLKEINCLDSSVIDINPNSIIHFLEKVDNENIRLKVNDKIAFIINYKTDIGEVYYYKGHEL